MASVKQVSNDIYSAGQLTEEELVQQIKEKGFKSVINIRSASENGFVDETDICKKEGVQYSHHATGTDSKLWTKELGDPIVTELSNAPKPVLIHCAGGNRAITFGLLREVKDNGVDFEKEADRVGMNVEGFRNYGKQYFN
jgi:protein tyrosine phosphatase (PTP) superfamily phosphohydrolase (DUF442 family)